MPTVLRQGPYRFFFYSSDGDEPRHVHVERDECVAKFWLEPIRLQGRGGFRKAEISRIIEVIEEHREELVEELVEEWNEYFGD